MDDPGTESLRKMAPSWSLAGDEQLLSILQNTHQRLLSKCQEANTQLEQMATALNDASISLQNVNNQFMALSSSQFIESRVYDDDDLEGDVPAVKEPPKPDVPDELTCLKRSVSVLENAHEIITILHDSDTESDTDDDMPARLVLKPKDMYADRPLPYIIGSQPWKNKWHAGLVLEDSESDSSLSKVDHDSEQYSPSEQSEPEGAAELRVRDTRDITVSETSSELPSEQGSLPKPTPSDVASEIARRLGAGEPPKVVEREPECEEPSKPAVRKVYRPQDPVTSTIFPDEPPPLSDSDSQESDIFADLHRHQPYSKTRLADDLFDADRYESDGGDILGDFANKPVSDPSAKPTSLFDAGPAPHMFVKHTSSDNRTSNMVRSQGRTEESKTNMVRQGISAEDQSSQRSNEDRTANMVRQGTSIEDGKVNIPDKQHVATDKEHRRFDDERRKESDVHDGRVKVVAEVERGVKKPVGGISLFGSKGTESIGAAILKRNQRKSSTSGEDSGSDARSEALHNNEKPIRKEKDIFDDLFARSEVKKVMKDKSDFIEGIQTEIRKKTEEKVKESKVEKPKVDLFSDNLFDDIDDIFSTNIVKIPPKDNTKSIFEDDDLFSDVAASKTVKNEASSSKIVKESLFDSDDELFSDNIIKSKNDKPKVSEIATKVNKINENSIKPSEPTKKSDEITRSIFDDDEDDIFSDFKTTNKVNEVIKVQNPVSSEKYNDVSKASQNTDPPKNNTNVFKSPSLFDDDDESDLFVEPAKSLHVQNVTTDNKKDFVENLSNKVIEISEEKLQKYYDPSSSVKTGDFEPKVIDNVNDEKNSKTIESGVNEIVNNTSESIKRIEEDSHMLALPVSKNVDRNNLDTIKNNETAAALIIENRSNKNEEQSLLETNDDFSDQDFDDLLPKVEEIKETKNINSNIVTDVKNSEAPIDVPSIFDKKTLESDTFAILSGNKQNTEDSEAIFKDTQPEFTEKIPKNKQKTDQDNKTTPIDTKNIEADIFSDILTEPPAFEKPKEPKKSKNVNALFDDDSDDESLFFKKNDAIFDYNPEDFSPTHDKLFGLFTDEPPDEVLSKISDDLDDDMFSTFPKPKVPQDESLPPLPNTNVDDETQISKIENKSPEIDKLDSDEDIFGASALNVTKLAAEIPKPSVSDINKSNENIFKPPNIEKLQNEKEKQTFLVKQEPKPRKTPSISDQLIHGLLSDDDEDLFQSIPTSETHHASLPTHLTEVPKNNNQDQVKMTDDEIFKREIIKPESFCKSDEDIFKIPKSKSQSKPDTIISTQTPPEDSKPEKVETKKVGKLKVGLNINVNALLPGAKSPKKVKPNDQADGQIISQPSENKKQVPNIPEIEKSELKIVLETDKPDPSLMKTVSFDGEPESLVLDNKLSKERPRIQVKRRPSSRRARKEAVRKSGIDFGEDSTDNSSSIDDLPRNKAEKLPDHDSNANKDEGFSKKRIENQLEYSNVPADNTEKTKICANPVETTMPVEIQAEKFEKPATIQSDNVETQAEIVDKPTYSRDVKSKVVYILNDEDIFNTNLVEKTEITTKNLDTKTENLDSSKGVTTLGKVYDKSDAKSDNVTKDSTKSLFGEDDDEKIFKGKTNEKKISIFDSDSEEELFGTSKKEVEKREVKKEIKREMVKGPLFGDEDDDDDLFGVKTKKNAESTLQPARSTVKESSKSAEPVFEDPLSMFGGDD